MTKQAKDCLNHRAEDGYNVGDLVMIHGVHLAVILLYYEPNRLWLVRLMCGQELALWREDLEPLAIMENENERSHDNHGKDEIRPYRG